MSADQLLLIDLSGLAHMAFHVSGNEPDPSFISTTIIARVRSLASEHLHAAVCLDSGKSFRADIDPSYKAQRDTENRGVIRHQIDVACETLKADGFPVWRVPGLEGDDIIATATAQAMKIDGTTVLIASSDKDALSLVSDRVSVKSLMTGAVLGPAEVFDRWGVRPAQIPDLLALMGDTSDNIKGAEKIGKVIGARLLSEHGTLAALYEKMAHGVVSGVTPGMRTNLMEFKARWPLVAQLIALRADAPIEFSEIAAERVAPPLEDAAMMDYTERGEHDAPRVPFKQGADANDAPLPWAVDSVAQTGEHRQTQADVPSQATTPDEPKVAGSTPAAVPQRIAAPMPSATSSGEAAMQKQFVGGAMGGGKVERMTEAQSAAVMPYAGPVDFSQQLEPRSMPEAKALAQMMFESRLFSAYGAPQAVLATILAGRELGIPAMASLRAFHIIEGRPTLSAGTIQSLVIKSGKAKYFRCTERTNERATFETQRGDDPPVSLSFSVEDGRRAWPKDDAAFLKSGWGKNPADLCVARASSKLARLVYPDVVSGLYAPEEVE